MKTPNKNVPIYVYYVTIEKQKNSTDTSKYNMVEIVKAFSKILQFTLSQELTERKFDNPAIEKIIWLDDFKDLSNGNYNLIFKSAKYNHVRNEIDTVNMTPLGQRKRPQDGDEEKTHLCIRLADGQMRFLAVHESNHYGISIKGMIDYINSQFEKFNEQSDENILYRASYEIVPSEEFLTQLKKAKTMHALKLEVDREVFKDDFWSLSGRNDIKEIVEVVIKRPKGIKIFPENLIKAYYNNMQSDNRIKSITVSGLGIANNKIDISTDLIKMKHYISVECEDITFEVRSVDFFLKAQGFIENMLRLEL